MVNKRGALKLVDFGAAFEVPRSGMANRFFGTPSYAAPEVYMNETAYPAKPAEAWCVGCCVFGMIYGDLPFEDRCSMDPPKVWIVEDEDNEEVNDLIVKLLSLDYSERWTCAQALSHPFLED
jgi:serine/threonine protein kinase